MFNYLRQQTEIMPKAEADRHHFKQSALLPPAPLVRFLPVEVMHEGL